jgi:K+-sensing histidine kinase KdpD
MSRSSAKHFPWPEIPVIWKHGLAVLSVIAVAIISLWPSFHLQTAPASLFLCAILFGAWLGGAGPGLLAAALAATIFYYYFLPPVHSFAAKPEEIPRFVVFLVAVLFVLSLSAAQKRATESVRRARDDLKATVQELQTTNEALQAESLERKHAEEELRQAQADLSRVTRMTAMGELTASLAHEVNQPIAAAVTNANACLRWLTRDHPDLEEAREAAMRS